MEPDKADELKILEIINNIHTIEAQEKLLLLVKDSRQLLESRIIPSLHPKVGREFAYNDLENKKKTLLINVREQLLELAAEERKRELSNATIKLSEYNCQHNKDNDTFINISNRLQKKSSTIANRINVKMNKKLRFHNNNAEKVVFTKEKLVRKKRKVKSKERKIDKITGVTGELKVRTE